MAAPQPELFNTFDYVPERQAFQLRGVTSDVLFNLQDLTNGKFRVIGHTVRDSATGRIVTNLNRTLGSFLHVGTEGTVLLNNRVQANRLAQLQGTNAIPRLEITGGLENLGLQMSQDVNLITGLAPRNTFVYVSDRLPITRRSYTTISAGIFGDARPPAANEFGRLATSEDLIRRGVTGWLLRNATAALEEAKLTGVELEDGTISTHVSEIISAIWPNIEVSPIATWVLSEAGA